MTLANAHYPSFDTEKAEQFIYYEPKWVTETINASGNCLQRSEVEVLKHFYTSLTLQIQTTPAFYCVWLLLATMDILSVCLFLPSGRRSVFVVVWLGAMAVILRQAGEGRQIVAI